MPWPRDTETPTSSVLQLAETHLDLREAIIKYEAIVDYLERLWAHKVCAKFLLLFFVGLVDCQH